jgi:hypothetical protein
MKKRDASSHVVAYSAGLLLAAAYDDDDAITSYRHVAKEPFIYF